MFNYRASIAIVTTVSMLQPALAVAQDLEKINSIAENITVKVTGYGNGSGVIYERSEDVYSVVTNQHVVPTDMDYQIQTVDGVKHRVTNRQDIPGLDLAIVQFVSTEDYELARFGDSNTLTTRQFVSVAGFPARETDLDIIDGQIRGIRQEVIQNPEPSRGYALAYTNPTLAGSSGGAVLDEEGFVIGINGQIEIDASTGIDIALGIPINLFLAASVTESNELVEIEERRNRLEEKLLANSESSQLPLNDVAENITVKITGHGDGSGVIFHDEDDIYSVVTNQHVTPVDADYKIRTYDGIEHQATEREEIPGMDLAIVKFASDNDYYTASFGDSDDLELLQEVYVAGFPGKQNDIEFRRGEITSILQEVLENPESAEGYALHYDNSTFSGTSGGGIIDADGYLVGINGEADYDDVTGRIVSRGIPINLFINSWVELNLESD